LAFAAHAQSPEVMSTFASAPPSGKYAFASWTLKTFADLMKGNQSSEAVNIVGHLLLPPGNEKVPAVVLVHGSGGIYNAELDFWPKQFNAAGIAVFTLDMFGPRGVQSTAEDQSQVPVAADTADAFAALRAAVEGSNRARDKAAQGTPPREQQIGRNAAVAAGGLRRPCSRSRPPCSHSARW